MKKIAIITAIVAIILPSFTGCDKYHRDRYIGDWDFVTKSEHYQMVLGKRELVGCDTIYYLGKITYGEYENHLIIQYTENHYDDAVIDKYGKIYTLCPGARCECGKFEGEDSVHFNKGWVTPDNPEYIVGTKRKGGK